MIDEIVMHNRTFGRANADWARVESAVAEVLAAGGTVLKVHELKLWGGHEGGIKIGKVSATAGSAKFHRDLVANVERVRRTRPRVIVKGQENPPEGHCESTGMWGAALLAFTVEDAAVPMLQRQLNGLMTAPSGRGRTRC